MVGKALRRKWAGESGPIRHFSHEGIGLHVPPGERFSVHYHIFEEDILDRVSLIKASKFDSQRIGHSTEILEYHSLNMAPFVVTAPIRLVDRKSTRLNSSHLGIS